MIPFDEIVISPPQCVFCRTTTGPFHREDVFPKWFRRVLPVGKSFRVGGEGLARIPKERNVLLLTLDKAICQKCNNGWMAVLEKRVSKIIKDAILAKGTLALNRTQQDDLARWAVQKALLMDLAFYQAGTRNYLRFGAPEHLRWLYEHRDTRRLPPGTGVWLFTHDIDQYKTPEGQTRSRPFLHSDWQLFHAEDIAAGIKEPYGVLSSFTIAFLGFQVLLTHFTDETPQRTPPTRPKSLQSFLTRIASGVSPIARWPRSQSVVKGVDGFRTFANWEGAFPRIPEEETDSPPET